MLAYRCNDCGNYFDEPATYTEKMGEFWGAPSYDTFSCCPCCKSEAIEEVDVDPEEVEVLSC
jgi:uncharacterized OB-fold protein